MKRLFIGIPVRCENALTKAVSWQNDPELKLNRLVWTLPANWHITLVFLGATDESAIPQLCQIIHQAFDKCPAYTSSLTGVGVFPSQRKPNVLWMGLDNIQPLLPFYERLVKRLQDDNFPFDSKPLKPHLTIARIKSLSNRVPFDNLLEVHRNTPFGEVPVNSIILYESTSTPNGVSYKPLYEYRLG